jgi:hypothetical protein
VSVRGAAELVARCLCRLGLPQVRPEVVMSRYQLVLVARVARCVLLVVWAATRLAAQSV